MCIIVTLKTPFCYYWIFNPFELQPPISYNVNEDILLILMHNCNILSMQLLICYGRPTYLSVDLYFTGILLSFFLSSANLRAC